ncbi:hypothetical protein J7J13_04355 [bacterium]|nr:hypothetical protein [bacterium]
MFNLTKKIKLASAWEKRYKILRVFVFLAFLAGMFWMGYLILFPSQYFSFSLLHPNSSKNTLVGFQKFEDKLIFNAASAGNFSKAKISFLLKKDSAPLENNKLSVRKSYQAFFYPTGENILSPADYSINSLVSSGKSVFIIGHNKKFPINNPRTFELSGFSWNNVKTADGKDLSQYKKQGLFTIDNAHPSGTVFLTKENSKYFYIQDEERHEIKGEALAKSDLRKKAVLAEEKGLVIKKECSLKKSFFFANHYSCAIPIDELNPLIGKDYQFEINFGDDIEVEKISVVMRKVADWKSFKLSLSEIKSKIFLRYGLQ